MHLLLSKKKLGLLFLLVLVATISIIFASGVNKVFAIDQYDQLRLKWREQLTGGNSFDPADPDFATQITSIDSIANDNWTSMDKASNRSYLWSDLASTRDSSHVTRSYERLRAMALAYSTHGSTLENNSSLKSDLISALDWMYTNRYNTRKKEYDNWWDWEIGTPLQLNDIVVMLYDDLTSSQTANYMNAVDHFSPTVTDTGYNRVAKAFVIGLRGVIVKNSSKIATARDGISPALPYVTSGDGFYTDGSFIQHTNYAYTGGYGSSMLQNTANFMYLFDGSTWQITDPNKANVYRWVYDSFEPLLYKGEVAESVKGRMISYNQWQNHEMAGQKILPAIIDLAQVANSSDAAYYKGLIKYMVTSDTFRNFMQKSPLYFAIQAKNYVNDSNIISRGELSLYKQFPSMDRAMQQRPGYGFAISMYSNRIANYESINNNNLKGWYTGDGMTFLYNNDLGQFGNDFWPTVNPYRLPGTTIDTQSRSNSSGAGSTSSKSWVGGVNLLNVYGATGMDYAGYSTTLTAKKSWFMFDNEVVALGAGVNSTSGRTIETIIENRKISDSNSENLTVNGTAKPGNLGWNETMSGVNWISLDNTAGYYFPDGATVKGLREARTGTWTAINSYGDQPTGSITRNYLTLWFDHGINPSNQTYAYTILPNMNPTQTSAYAANPETTIVANTSSVQAVEENTLGILGANFWTAGTADYITSSNAAAVMAKQDAGAFTVAVSDPTQNQSTITVEFDKTALGVISKDAQITVLQMTPTIKLQINVSGAKGKTFTASFNQIQPTPTMTPTPTSTPMPTPTSDPNITPSPTAIPTPTVTPSPTPEVQTFSPAADAFVRDGSYASTNYGTGTVLTTKNDKSAGYTRQSFIRFDLSNYSGTVSNAKLRLYPSTVGMSGVTNNLSTVADTTWNETSITWDNKPAAGTLVGSWVPVLGNWVEIDITAQVQAAMAGNKNFGFIIYSPTNVGSSGNINYDSKEGINTPQIVITP